MYFRELGVFGAFRVFCGSNPGITENTECTEGQRARGKTPENQTAQAWIGGPDKGGDSFGFLSGPFSARSLSVSIIFRSMMKCAGSKAA